MTGQDWSIQDKRLVITNDSVVLGIKNADRISIIYQPKTLY